MDPELAAKLTKLFYNIEPPSLEEHSEEPPQEPEPAILWAQVFPELVPPEKEGINNNNNNENEEEEEEEENEESSAVKSSKNKSKKSGSKSHKAKSKKSSYKKSSKNS